MEKRIIENEGCELTFIVPSILRKLKRILQKAKSCQVPTVSKVTSIYKEKQMNSV